MGIPGLTLRLLNRGQWITLERRQQHSGTEGQPERDVPEQHSQIAIIDGPGLAYHVCGGYREESTSDGAAELRPSYRDIGRRTVEFLEDIEAVGLNM